MALEQAQCLIADAGSSVAAAQLAVETAGLACAGAHPSTAALAERARRQAIETRDPISQTDLQLLAAAHALRTGAPREALESCRTARRHALDAVAPLQYVTAAVAFARVADAVDERVQAYESLVVGWVTLADLLGDEAGRSVFGVELAAMRERWGDEAFAAARGAYDERRRRELGRRR
ncbi:MAG: hypothetical protein LC777_07095 [Actinobacteria bacterium]|nr:hypothetical protein [Actinomycetota bacterium]